MPSRSALYNNAKQFSFIFILTMAMLQGGCQDKAAVVTQSPNNESGELINLPTIESNNEESTQPLAHLPNIVIDGNADDWRDREIFYGDPEGDGEAGYLDLTDGYAFFNDEGLYFMVELTEPDTDFAQIYIFFTASDEKILIIWDQNTVDGWVYDVNDPTNWIETGKPQNSSLTIGNVLEGRIDYSDIAGYSEIDEFTGIEIWAGLETDGSWRIVDSWEPRLAPDQAASVNETTSKSPIEMTNIIIDGFADDWDNLMPQSTDDSGDSSPGSVDLDSFTFFLSDTSLYGMVSVYEWGLYEFITFQVIDKNGHENQIYFGTQSGVGGISRFNEFNFAVPIVAQQNEVIEFRINLDDIEIEPESVGNVSICCDSEHNSTDTILGLTPLQSFIEVKDETQYPLERNERPGPGYLLEEGSYPNYLYRAFIQNPERSTLGPDGNIYVADNAGRHIVRLSLDGSVEDMGFWRGAATWIRHGPSDVAFGPDGTMYIADDAFIYRVMDDNSLEHLRIHGWPSAIEFGPDGFLYYIETIEWAIYKWDFSKDPQKIAQIDNAYDIAFMHDGRIVVAQIGGKVFTIDSSSGDTELFYEQAYTPDPIYVTVGPDGDVWIRAIHQVDRVSPEGVKKPIIVEGVEIDMWGSGMPNDTDGWSMSGDIVFDDNGKLWLFSASSRVLRLTSIDEYGWTLEKVIPGFTPSDMIHDGGDSLLVLNDYSNELWRISLDGEIDVLLHSTQITSRNGLTVDTEGRILIGSVGDGIIRLDSDGEQTPIANIEGHRMVHGSDGALYIAFPNRVGTNYEIARMMDREVFTVFKDSLGGQPIGDGSQILNIGNSNDGGLFIYEQTSGLLYKVNLDGEEELYFDFNLLGDKRPWVMGFSPQGIPFFPYHTPAHPGSIGYLSEEKEIIPIIIEVSGDPSWFAFSPQGDMLYVGAFGVIMEVPLHWEN